MIQSQNFEEYKSDSNVNYCINNVLYKINNFPEMVHNQLYGYYYYINIMNGIIIDHNLTDIDLSLFNDNDIIFVRVNIIDKMHINCLLIDINKKEIILIDPNYSYYYNKNIIYFCVLDTFLTFNINIDDYIFITNSTLQIDNFSNSIQKFNMFCQLYSMLFYEIIKDNRTCDYVEYGDIIKKYTTNEFLGLYSYILNEQLMNIIINKPIKMIAYYPNKILLNLYTFLKIKFF